jgi:predicted amidophosphoribosyltransferase
MRSSQVGAYIKETGSHFERYPFNLVREFKTRKRCSGCGAAPTSAEAKCDHCGAAPTYSNEAHSKVIHDPFGIEEREAAAEKRRAQKQGQSS